MLDNTTSATAAQPHGAVAAHYANDKQRAETGRPAALALDDHVVEDILKKGAIPSPPILISKLVKILSSDDYSVNDVAEVVESDASAAVKVVSVANSAAFAGARQIESVRDAVNRMGVQTTRDIVSSHAMKSVFAPQNAGALSLLKVEWRLSTLVATMLRMSAREYAELGAPDAAYTMGLFHNLGVPVLICSLEDEDLGLNSPDLYARIGRAAGALGGVLALKWVLGDDAYRVAIRFGRPSVHPKWQMSDMAALARAAASRQICTENKVDEHALTNVLNKPGNPVNGQARYERLESLAAELIESGQA